jgi:signal transduction histidine kinase
LLIIFNRLQENLINPDEQLNDSTQGSSTTLNRYESYTKLDDKLKIQERAQQDDVDERQVIYGEEAVKRVLNNIVSKCKSELLLYGDKNLPSVILEISSYRESLTSLKNSNVKIKLLTEVTTDNLKYCKQFIKDFGAEIRHLKGIRGNFALTGESYITMNVLKKRKLVNDLMYGNIKDFIDQNQYIFDTLWKNAIPVEQRIMKIEGDLFSPETYAIQDAHNILDYAIDLVENIGLSLSCCTSKGYFRVLDQNTTLFQAYLKLISKYKEGKVKTEVRWITHLEDSKEDLNLVKKLLDLGFKIKHTNNLPQLNFIVSEKCFVSTIENVDSKKLFDRLLQSTEPLYVKHFQIIFEELWKNSIDAEERIYQIDKGIGSESTKLINSPDQSKMLLINTIENAKQEILMVFPSINAVKRKNKIGVIDLLKEKSQNDVKVKVLSPQDAEVVKILMYRSDNINHRNSEYLVREITKQRDFKRTILLVDRKHFLAIEPRDDSYDTFEEATAVSTYSTSQPTIYSYISIFESLWEQTEMANNLRAINEKLIESEETEREFINVAAHELRTPTQAITGYAEMDEEMFDHLLKNRKEMKEHELERILGNLYNHHSNISRNAERLDDLINNLLDVARIDSNQKNMIMLHKENFDLIREIRDIINDQLNHKLRVKDIKVNFLNDTLAKTCIIYADRSRLNQILNNLLHNAIKFSPAGSHIDIMIQENINEKIRNEEPAKTNKSIVTSKDDGKQVYISISDSGKGISSLILPRLFQKFFTDSNDGTGLGLYICKKLVEAQGGKIWAFNNNSGIGSTFVFSLPKTNHEAILDKE